VSNRTEIDVEEEERKHAQPHHLLTVQIANMLSAPERVGIGTQAPPFITPPPASRSNSGTETLKVETSEASVCCPSVEVGSHRAGVDEQRDDDGQANAPSTL